MLSHLSQLCQEEYTDVNFLTALGHSSGLCILFIAVHKHCLTCSTTPVAIHLNKTNPNQNDSEHTCLARTHVQDIKLIMQDVKYKEKQSCWTVKEGEVGGGIGREGLHMKPMTTCLVG